MPLTSADYRLQVRHLIRDTAGLGATPNPALFIFTDDEIDEYVQDGLTEYIRYRKRRRPTSLSLVVGQTQYPLPTDWITVDMESFATAVAPPEDIDWYSFAGFVLPTLTPSLPVWNLVFDWYDSDQMVQLNTPPQAASTLNFAYFAIHTIDASGSTIPQQDARFVSLMGASYALNALAVDKGQKMQKYRIGKGITIDDTEVTKTLQAQADKYAAEFNKRIVMTAIGVSG